MAKLRHLSSVIPRGPKFTFFTVLTKKWLLCVIYAVPTPKGIKYNISMVSIQKRGQINPSYNACQKKSKICYLMVNIQKGPFL